MEKVTGQKVRNSKSQRRLSLNSIREEEEEEDKREKIDEEESVVFCSIGSSTMKSINIEAHYRSYYFRR